MHVRLLEEKVTSTLLIVATIHAWDTLLYAHKFFEVMWHAIWKNFSFKHLENFSDLGIIIYNKGRNQRTHTPNLQLGLLNIREQFSQSRVGVQVFQIIRKKFSWCWKTIGDTKPRKWRKVKFDTMVLGSSSSSQCLQILTKIMNIFSHFSYLFLFNLMANSVWLHKISNIFPSNLIWLANTSLKLAILFY